jgi:hypothetical protein
MWKCVGFKGNEIKTGLEAVLMRFIRITLLRLHTELTKQPKQKKHTTICDKSATITQHYNATHIIFPRPARGKM